MNESRVRAVKAAVQQALSTPPTVCYASGDFFRVQQCGLKIANVYVILHSDDVCRIRVVGRVPETLDVDAVLCASQTAPRALRMESRAIISVTLVISNEVEHDKMLSDVASVMRALVAGQLGCEE
jgi:hypothetical protein